MSGNSSKFNRDRVTSILEVGRRVVLCHIFSCGTPNKSDATPLDQYLENLPSNSTANFPRVSRKERKFNNTELIKIHNDKKCTTFDITLLWKVIKLACENVADYNNSSAWKDSSTRMEYYVTAIKDERNDSMHGEREITTKELLDKVARLRKLFHDALDAAKIRYERSDAELASKKKEVNDEIDKIMCEVLGEEDLMNYDISNLKDDLIKETNKVLEEYFMNSLNIDPMSFLTGTKLHLQVQKVFTEIKVTRGRVRGEGQSLKYEKLVEAARSGPGPTQPQVVLVEGIAGSGKTTFLTLVTNEWLKDAKDRTITGLDYYDLLLRVQCRERKITSLNCLLENELSRVWVKFRNLVLPLVKNCKILILIDGLDECNEDSKKLVDDILTQMKTVKGCTLLFTSRPEGITNFISRIPAEYQVSYIDLIGISESCRTLFVRRYHEEIKHQIGNTQDTDELVEKVHQVLEKEHFRLPLNMVFLTWIYIHDPSAITSTTTQTQLYHSTYQLCQQKLLDRLARHTTTCTFDRETLEIHLKPLLEKIHYESLLALWRSQLIFETEAIDSIKDSCKDQDIPYRELLSAFFTLKASRGYLGITVEQYFAPHKGLQEFYAALHIVNHLKPTSSSASVRKVLLEALGNLGRKLRRLQNALYHVAGLLHLPPNIVPETLTKEVLRMLFESGMETREQWLDLVQDTRANTNLLRRVASYFVKCSPVKLVMRPKKVDDEEEEERDEEDEGDKEDKGDKEDEKENEEGKKGEEEEGREETENRKREKKMDKKKEEEKDNDNKEKEEKKTSEEGDSDSDDSDFPISCRICPVLIQDTRTDSLTALLPFLPPWDVDIKFEKDPVSCIGDLLNAMAHHTCNALTLMHHYKDPDPTATSDHLLQQVLPRYCFTGHLTEDSLRLLPRSLMTVCLALSDDDHATRILKTLHSVYQQLPFLHAICIHVPMDRVTSSSLSPVFTSNNKKKEVRVCLNLSNIKDDLIEEAWRVVQALQWPGGYFDGISFPRASASYAGWRKLVEGLAEAGVKVNYMTRSYDTTQNKDEDDKLEELSQDKLECSFGSRSDRKLWPDRSSCCLLPM